ncbi:MAG: flgG [Bacteriovoracaceae bacterium]|nr:flgG [Bacteriovoracaceae bacterium]
MIKSLYTAATGMDAQQTRIAVISNNIANLNTTGFKSSRAEFQDLIYETRSAPGGETATGINAPGGLQIGSGVRVVSTPNQVSQGTLQQTGNPLDLAIEGRGFLSVQLPNGETAYTRAGALSVDATGKVVTQNGFPIVPNITTNKDGVNRTIGVDGTISATVPPASVPTVEGQIGLFTFPNEAGLSSIGRNLYQESIASGTATQGVAGTAGVGTIQQGFIEGSNVNIANELVTMILAQRAYELNSKVIQTSDQMLQSTSQIR